MESFTQLPQYSMYMMQTMSMVTAQVRRTESFLRLYSSFIEAGIHPIVMKGIVCRQLYGDYKDNRPSGDEDILVQKKDFKCIEEVLIHEGFVVENENVYTDAQLELLQEVTFYNNSSGVSIEVHLNPIGCEDSWHRKANDYFKNVFTNCQDVDIDGVMICTMSHTENLLFLIMHTLKHFIIGGVGIRQVMDILLYYRQYGEQCDFKYILNVLGELKADLFFSNLIHIGNRYLGFELSAPFASNCPECLLNDILDSGTFGNSTEAQRNVSAWTSAALEKSQDGENNRFKELLYMAFPPKSWMLRANPELAEKPWLLPRAWAQRWVRIFKRHKSNDGNLILESRELGQQKIELLREYKIL